VNVADAESALVVSLPEVDFAPVQPPDAVQLVALVVVHASCVVPCAATVVGVALKVSVGAPAGGGALAIVTLTDFEVLPPEPVHTSVKVLAAFSVAL
jgi:hypothetical protein